MIRLNLNQLCYSFLLLKMQLMCEQHITVFVLSKINFIYELFSIKFLMFIFYAIFIQFFFSFFVHICNEVETKCVKNKFYNRNKNYETNYLLKEVERNKDGTGDIFSWFLGFLIYFEHYFFDLETKMGSKTAIKIINLITQRS